MLIHALHVLKEMVQVGVTETANGKLMSAFHCQVSILLRILLNFGVNIKCYLCIVVTTDKYTSIK